jgi:beta-lactamase superfamily II metal-dependent hydrolase
MVLIEASSGSKFVFDCNITDDNEDRVLDYIANQIGEGKSLHAFICSHRDADHMRGVKKLHARFPIKTIWDSDYPGTTTDSSEYRAYMDLRRQLGSKTIEKQKYFDYGRTRLRMLSAKDDRLASNANAQGIVIKVEQRNESMDRIQGSAMLPADSDAETWRLGILADYSKSDVSSNIMMAAHHGSTSFFDDPNLTYYYKDHMAAIKPAMTVVSVGPNSHGHPNETALGFYREYSTGSDKGNKVFRTDTKGTMKLTLKSGGGWNLSPQS